MYQVDWNDPALKRWLDSITRKTTKFNYKSAFRNYAEFTGMTATELIKEAHEDRQLLPLEQKDVVIHKLTKFYKWLTTEAEKVSRGKGEHKVKGKGLTPRSATMKVNCIRSFYSTFHISVKLRGRHRLANGKVKNKRMIVNAEQVKLLIQHARSIRDRAIILVNFQGGMDASTLCSLNYEDIVPAVQTGEHPFKLELLRKKSDTEYYTFLGKDAVEALKAYVADQEARGTKWNLESPLFTKSRHQTDERITPNLIQNMMKEVAVSAGLVKRNNGKDFNILGSHALRESFSSLMLNSGVPRPIVDFWLGHTRSNLDTAYMTIDETKAREMYAKREHLLNINETSEKSEELRKLSDSVSDILVKREEMKEQLDKTTAEVKDLKEQLKSATEIIYGFEPMLNTFNAIADTKEGQELINKIHEAKMKQEMMEAQEETEKLRAEITKEHPTPKKDKSEYARGP
jgi:integrase